MTLLPFVDLQAQRAALTPALQDACVRAIERGDHVLGADVDALFVKQIQVNDGPMMKRWHARAKGRGARIEKRTSHIMVTVSDDRPKKTAAARRKV